MATSRSRQEQEELRREARAFLEANPDAPLSALRELGWLGVSVPEERGGGGLSFVDEAILFEEAGRALYARAVPDDGASCSPRSPRSTSRPGRSRSTGLVPDLLHVDRVADRGDALRPGRGREHRHDGRDAPARAADGRRGRARRRRVGAGAAAPPRRALGRGVGVAAKALELARRVRLRARAVREEDRHLPGRLAPARGHLRRDRARPLARLLGRVVRRRGRRAALPSRSPPRSRSAPRRPSPRASARSRCTAGSASRGSTRCTGYYKRAQWIDAFGGHAARHREAVAAAILD